MYLMTTVHAYDALGTVQISAVVREHLAGEEWQITDVFSCATAVDGVGETDPRRWLRDALVALAETL